MRSILAALRSLVLPFGVTTGQRILLDGINGVISMFNASNVETLREDSTTGKLTMPYGTAGQRIELDGNLGVISLFNAANVETFHLDSSSLSMYNASAQLACKIDVAASRFYMVSPAGFTTFSVYAPTGDVYFASTAALNAVNAAAGWSVGADAKMQIVGNNTVHFSATFTRTGGVITANAAGDIADATVGTLVMFPPSASFCAGGGIVFPYDKGLVACGTGIVGTNAAIVLRSLSPTATIATNDVIRMNASWIIA